MAQPLTYRLYQNADLPGMLRLWEESSGWGTLTPEVWRQWYVDTPQGPCVVVVAVDAGGDIVGQMVFTPSLVLVDGTLVLALRLSAPILRKDLRRVSLRSVDHPVVGLYLAGMKAAITQGYRLVYGLPDPAWFSFFQWSAQFDALRFAVAEYVCVARTIAQTAHDVEREDGGLAARLVTDFGMRFDDLWQSAQETFPIDCGIVRSAASLKYRHGGHLVLEVHDAQDDALVGYTAIKPQTALLVDILARRPADLVPVLAATRDWLVRERRAGLSETLSTLKAMETPTLRPALRALGFTPVEYRFVFICKSLDPHLTDQTTTPEHWHIMPGD